MKKQLTSADVSDRINDKNMFDNNEIVYALQFVLDDKGSIKKDYFSPNWFKINRLHQIEYICPSLFGISVNNFFKLYKGYTKLRAGVNFKSMTDEQTGSNEVSDIKVTVREGHVYIRSRKTITTETHNDISTIRENDIYETNSIVELGADMIIGVIFVGPFCPPVVRIFKFNDNLEVRNTKTPAIPISLINDDCGLDLIHSSYDDKMTYKKRKSTVERSNKEYIIESPKMQLVRLRDNLAVIDNENIIYDNNGEVIEYNNPLNHISMKTDVYEDYYTVKKIYFYDKLVDYHFKASDNFGRIEAIGSGYISLERFNKKTFTIEKICIKNEPDIMSVNKMGQIADKMTFDVYGNLLRTDKIKLYWYLKNFVEIPDDVRNIPYYYDDTVILSEAKENGINMTPNYRFSLMCDVNENVKIFDNSEYNDFPHFRYIKDGKYMLNSCNLIGINNNITDKDSVKTIFKFSNSVWNDGNSILYAFNSESGISFNLQESLVNGLYRVYYKENNMEFVIENGEVIKFDSPIYDISDGLYIRNKYGIPTKLDLSQVYKK